MIDANIAIRNYLLTQTALTALVGTRIYAPLKKDTKAVVPDLPVGTTLPAVTFIIRGGTSTPYTPGITEPSFQFKCFDNDPIDARTVYRALYDSLQGIQNVTVGTYHILSAIEEVQGQDLQDPVIPNLYYVLTFFSIMVR
jgi:hypothetical protein